VDEAEKWMGNTLNTQNWMGSTLNTQKWMGNTLNTQKWMGNNHNDNVRIKLNQDQHQNQPQLQDPKDGTLLNSAAQNLKQLEILQLQQFRQLATQLLGTSLERLTKRKIGNDPEKYQLNDQNSKQTSGQISKQINEQSQANKNINQYSKSPFLLFARLLQESHNTNTAKNSEYNTINNISNIGNIDDVNNIPKKVLIAPNNPKGSNPKPNTNGPKLNTINGVFQENVMGIQENTIGIQENTIGIQENTIGIMPKKIITLENPLYPPGYLYRSDRNTMTNINVNKPNVELTSVEMLRRLGVRSFFEESIGKYHIGVDSARSIPD
jgi:hypothetical protein